MRSYPACCSQASGCAPSWPEADGPQSTQHVKAVMPPSLNAPSRGLCHVLSNSGFFDFSHCRVFPLEYRLLARFDTIPSRPSSQALANTSAPSATRASLNRMQWTPATRGESAARRSSIGRRRKSSPLRFRRSNATRQDRAEPASVRKAVKSEYSSGRTATASPSISALRPPARPPELVVSDLILPNCRSPPSPHGISKTTMCRPTRRRFRGTLFRWVR